MQEVGKNDTILIGRPRIERRDDAMTARLCSDLYLDHKPVYTMWFEVDEKYAQYLCEERSDAFVVVLLLYAMEHGLDIVWEEKLSEKLYYQLTEYLIPCISSNIPKYNKIRLQGPVSNEPLHCAGAVGTALSGGVDSFYTLIRHLDRGPNYSITHFCFFNEGSCGEFGGENARSMYHERIAWIRDVALRLGKDMVLVDGNANEFLQQRHQPTYTFRTLSNVLALQKLFGIYYMASSYPFAKFRFSEKDAGWYDLLTAHCLSTETISFYISGGETTRQGKIAAIADYPLTYDRLNVCDVHATNCGKCEKCRRTMTGLYSMDKLDLYGNVFDLKQFQTDRRKYVQEACIRRKEAFWDEIYDTLRSKGKITVWIRSISLVLIEYAKLRVLCKRIPFANCIYRKIRRHLS